MDEKKIGVGEAAEPQEKTRAEEEKPAKLEKPPKKPGAVSRFFNQFGIGKYWERLNDYFEHEEKMEAAAAEKEAAKETAEGMESVAKEEIIYIKNKGAEIPAKIEESATRAGAGSAEAAPVVAEAKAEEAKIEQEAEAAKADLDEEIKVFVAEPASLNLPSTEEIIRAHESGKGEKLPPVEEFEAIAKEHEAKQPPSIEKIKAVEVLDEEVEEAEAPPSIGEVKPVEVISEEVIEPGEEEMEKAKVEPVSLKKIKKTGEVRAVASWDDIEPIKSKELEKAVKAGKFEPKISSGFKARLPELAGIMEEAFFAKGEKGSKLQLNRMAKSLERVREAYAAQTAAKEISPQDEKALKKWIAETKGATEIISAEPEKAKPAKVIELKKSAKKKAPGRRVA